MKYEWRKQDKNLYLPPKQPHIIDVPEFKFLMISGQGDPNTSQGFSDAIGALYSFSYSIKMLPKKGIVPEGYFEYTVFPLEGVWDLTEESKDFYVLDKSKLIYTIMIRQPDFVSEEIAKTAFEMLKAKKSEPRLEEVRFGSIKDGLCVQMLHIGKFDDEAKSFALMDEYCAENGYVRTERYHREIYISDFRKTDPKKLQTVLRYKVAKNEE